MFKSLCELRVDERAGVDVDEILSSRTPRGGMINVYSEPTTMRWIDSGHHDWLGAGMIGHLLVHPTSKTKEQWKEFRLSKRPTIMESA